jgi:hypothetical protein
MLNSNQLVPKPLKGQTDSDSPKKNEQLVRIINTQRTVEA